MRRTVQSCLFLALALLATTGCEPVWMLPGGALSGPVEPVPADWSFSDSFETVQLETSPDDPYSVNVWGVGVGRNFYVAAGRGKNRWARNLAEDPRVRLRIGDDVYEMKAVRVESDAELEAFLAAAKRKYDFEPDEEQREDAALFRLERR